MCFYGQETKRVPFKQLLDNPQGPYLCLFGDGSLKMQSLNFVLSFIIH